MTFIDLSTLSRTHGGSQPLRGYLATPAGAGPWPGVVMVHEAETGPRPLRPLMRAAHMGSDPAAATDAWRRIEAFLHAQLD